MLHYIFEKKHRLNAFLKDTAKGFGLMWQSAKMLTLINILLYILQAVLPLLSLLLLKRFIDDLLATQSIIGQGSGIVILLFFLVQAAMVVVTELSAYYLQLHQQIISNNMAHAVLTKAIGLDLEYFENPEFIDQLYRAQWQTLYRPAELISSLQGFIQSSITILFFSGFLFTVHWSVPLLLVLLSIPLAVSRLLQGYQQHLLHINNSSLERRAYDFFDYLTSYEFAKELRIFHYGSYFMHNFMSLKKAIYRKGKRLHNRFLKVNMSIRFLEIAVMMLIYGIILQKTVITAVSVGGLVVYLSTFQRLQGAITGFYQSCIHLFQQQLYLQQVLEYLALPPLIKNEQGSVAMPSLSGGIRLKNLSFTYPQTNKQVLKGINMHFPAGKIIAIVGENGSGKSTLVKLLCRLYSVNQQSIFIDQTDITSIAQEDLQKNITAIFQDFGKYYLSIKENITLGHSVAQESLLNAAARKSGFLNYLPSFSSGYQTPLGRTYKNGEQLSGGQWQKLALTRAFYKKSPILILDEPTSALDPVSEYEVLKNLKKELNEDKVIIMISHRLYNLKVADYIYVLHDGMIAESGTFEELLFRKGVFFDTYKTQIV